MRSARSRRYRSVRRVCHLPQRIFNFGQAAVFDLPQAAADLPVQGAAVGQAVTRCRVGDNGGIQRKVGAAPVERCPCRSG